MWKRWMIYLFFVLVISLHSSRTIEVQSISRCSFAINRNLETFLYRECLNISYYGLAFERKYCRYSFFKFHCQRFRRWVWKQNVAMRSKMRSLHSISKKIQGIILEYVAVKCVLCHFLIFILIVDVRFAEGFFYGTSIRKITIVCECMRLCRQFRYFREFLTENHRLALFWLLIISGDVELNPGPLTVSPLKNTCLARPGYYSCGIDSLCELFTYSVFPYIVENQEFNDDCFIFKALHSFAKHRTGNNQYILREEVWNMLCRLFPAEFCPRGNFVELGVVYHAFSDSNLFCLKRTLRCVHCKGPTAFNHDLCPAVVTQVHMPYSNTLNDAISNCVQRSSSRLSPCCRMPIETDSILNFPQFFTVRLSIIRSQETGVLEIFNEIVISSHDIIVKDVRYSLSGAIRASGDHFTAIVKHNNVFIEIDDLNRSTPVQYERFVDCANRRISESCVLRKESLIAYLIFHQSQHLAEESVTRTASSSSISESSPISSLKSVNQNRVKDCDSNLGFIFKNEDLKKETCNAKLTNYNTALKRSHSNSAKICDDNLLNNLDNYSETGASIDRITDYDKSTIHSMNRNEIHLEQSALDYVTSNDINASFTETVHERHIRESIESVIKKSRRLDACTTISNECDKNLKTTRKFECSDPGRQINSAAVTSNSIANGDFECDVQSINDETAVIGSSSIDSCIKSVLEKAILGELEHSETDFSSVCRRRMINDKKSILRKQKRKFAKSKSKLYTDNKLQKMAETFLKEIDPSLQCCNCCKRIKFLEQMYFVGDNDALDSGVCKQCIDQTSIKIPENVTTREVPMFSKLNYLEKRMLNIVNVFMTIVRLPGGQKGETGQAIHFLNDLNDVQLILPHSLKSAHVLLLDSPDESNKQSVHQKHIRLDFVQHCHNWLLQHNVFFQHLRRNTLPFYFLKQLIKQSSEDTDTDDPVLKHDSFIDEDYQPKDINDFLKKDESSYGKFSFNKIQSSMLNSFKEQSLEEKAFVGLFPFGTGGYDAVKKSGQLTLQQYFKCRLLASDSRFRLDHSYLFWALNMLEQDRLQGRISVALKTKFIDQSDMSLKASTDRTIQDVLRDKGYTFLQNIRGTAGYWMNVMMDLLAKVATLGPPTWFVTISADDLGWADYQKLLRADLGTSYPNSNLEAVIKNPVMCALQFNRRWLALRHFLKSSQCLGEITDSFERVEFQSRGSPHLHMFLWIKDAPKLDNPSDKDKLVDFIDKYVYTTTPSDPDDASLVKTLQTHKHTDTCWKRGKMVCRFSFPRKVCAETSIKKGKLLGSKRFYETRRNIGDEWINAYNIDVLRLFRSNMDIQFVGNVYGVCMYVCSYICKAEPKKFREDIEKVINRLKEMRNGLTPRQILSRFGTAVLTKRLVSAQEAAFRVLGLPLCYSTRKSLFINCRKFTDRHRVVRNDALNSCPNTHINANTDLAQLFVPGLIEHYCNRPNNSDFENMSLARFAAWYTIGSQAKRRILLMDGVTAIHKREKPACLRTNGYSQVTDPEGYYLRLLMLHLPFRNEVELLVPFSSYAAAFKSNYSKLDKSYYGIEKLYAELQTTIQSLQIFQSDTLEDLVGHLTADRGKIDDRVDETLYDDILTTNPLNCPNNNDTNEQFESDVNEKLCSLFKSQMTDAAFAKGVEMLNCDQKRIFLRVKHSIQSYLTNNDEQLALFISGPAGTGKSYIINMLSELVTRMVGGSPDRVSVVRSAPTGVASRHITGMTLHRAFLLPVDHNFASPMYPLRGEVLKSMRDFYRDVVFLVIDEISMVSYRTFQNISKRLCEIKGNDRLFGGINVIVLGDFFQLKPVKDSFLFKPKGVGFHLFNDWFKLEAMNIQMRQTSDFRFSALLSRLRMGSCNSEDIELLLSRVNIHLSEGGFETAIRIFPTKKQVQAYNNEKLEVLEGEINKKSVILNAKDRALSNIAISNSAISNDDSESSGLPKVLNLLENSRIMLIRNISCDDGLTNGLLGYVSSFEYDYDFNVSRIHINFDDIPGNTIIEPISVKFLNRNGNLCERTQFPLMLAWACTIHKVQGLTLKKAVIDVGTKLFQPAMAYVALSRVKSLVDISLTDFSAKKLTCFKDVLNYYQEKFTTFLIT